MEIYELEGLFAPQIWAGLRRYFQEELRAELEEKLRAALSPAESETVSPVPVKPAAKAAPKAKRGSSGLGRKVEFPPPLDASALAYIPTKVQKMRRTYEAVALRRDLIAEVLKTSADGATLNEIQEHLGAARFPTKTGYYAAISSNGIPRIRASIGNDLSYFLKRGWARQLSNGRWKWVRSRLFSDRGKD